MHQLKGLTGIRWIAAFWVFIFHVDIAFRTPLTWLPGRVQAVVQQGRLGVTTFFVLSGFILAYSCQRDFPTATFRGGAYYACFLLRRIARIYPVYVVALLVDVALSIKFAALPSVRVIVANLVMATPYWPPIAMLWYSAGAWSMCVEMFFYLLFPLLYPLLLRIRSQGALLGLLALLALAGFASGFNSPSGTDNALHYAFPPLRLPEFAAGIVGAILTFRRGWQVPSWLAVGLIPTVAVYLAYVGPVWQSTVVHNWLVVPAIVCVLNALVQERITPALRWLESPLMVYLGKISYSFFVFQIPLGVLLDALIGSGKISHTNGWVFPIAFLISLLGGILLHSLVEVPAHRWVSNWRYRSCLGSRCAANSA